MEDGEPGSRLGWQVVSSMSLEEPFVSTSLWPRLTLHRALVPFRGRPHGECALHHQSATTADSTLSRSACFFYAAFGSLSLSLRVLAGVACHSTLVATTAQCAQWQWFWDAGVSQWKVRPHGFSEAGARMSVNVGVQDMDLALPDAFGQPLSGDCG